MCQLGMVSHVVPLPDGSFDPRVREFSAGINRTAHDELAHLREQPVEGSDDDLMLDSARVQRLFASEGHISTKLKSEPDSQGVLYRLGNRRPRRRRVPVVEWDLSFVVAAACPDSLINSYLPKSARFGGAPRRRHNSAVPFPHRPLLGEIGFERWGFNATESSDMPSVVSNK